MKPEDTETVVYVAVSRDFLPQLREWSPTVRVRVVEEDGNEIRLELQRVEVFA